MIDGGANGGGGFKEVNRPDIFAGALCEAEPSIDDESEGPAWAPLGVGDC